MVSTIHPREKAQEDLSVTQSNQAFCLLKKKKRPRRKEIGGFFPFDGPKIQLYISCFKYEVCFQLCVLSEVGGGVKKVMHIGVARTCSGQQRVPGP